MLSRTGEPKAAKIHHFDSEIFYGQVFPDYHTGFFFSLSLPMESHISQLEKCFWIPRLWNWPPWRCPGLKLGVGAGVVGGRLSCTDQLQNSFPEEEPITKRQLDSFPLKLLFASNSRDKDDGWISLGARPTSLLLPVVIGPR